MRNSSQENISLRDLQENKNNENNQYNINKNENTRPNSPIDNFRVKRISPELLKNLYSRSDDFILKSRFDKYEFLLSENNLKEKSSHFRLQQQVTSKDNLSIEPLNYKASKKYKTELKLIQVDGQNIPNKPNSAVENNNNNNIKNNNLIDNHASKREVRIKFKNDEIPNSNRNTFNGNEYEQINAFSPDPINDNKYNDNKNKFFFSNSFTDRKEIILGDNIILKNRINNGQSSKNFKFNTFNKSKTTKYNNSDLNNKKPNENKANQRSNFNKDSKLNINEFEKYKFPSTQKANLEDFHLIKSILFKKII